MEKSDQILARLMTLHPKVIDLTLDRMWRLLAALGEPQKKLPPVIHIAGTNGKGSTLAMIRAGLEASGAKVHAYTSPHLVRFHERIRVAGELIDERELSAILDECEVANKGVPITYFEITTCAALLAFSRVPADFTLLEVGLGGRLDATNVVEQPRLSVISPVDLDHQQFLGDTIKEIAAEKAGIVKPGVTCVVARQQPEAGQVIELKCATMRAPISAQGQHWHCRAEHERLVFEDSDGLLDLPLPGLPGAHQIENAGTAIAALRELGIDEAACASAMTQAQWPARMQKLRYGPLTQIGCTELWLDGGHNPAAGRALADMLAALPQRPTYLICGMLNTKDVAGYLAPMAPHTTALYSVSIPGEPNTLSATQTAQAARQCGIDAQPAASVCDALKVIVARDAQARVLICGSLYLAGQILSENG